ncbi:hypothetical protein Tco_0266313 [Tanacetum coccineum]
MTGAKFDIDKFDEIGDFGFWRIKMHALLVQHRCETALEVLPVDMEAEAKAELNKKAHSDDNDELEALLDWDHGFMAGELILSVEEKDHIKQVWHKRLYQRGGTTSAGKA